jgi:hypothetical protein
VLRKEQPEPNTPFATTLTIAWPVPFTPSFEERPHVEGLLRQFLQPASEEVEQ